MRVNVPVTGRGYDYPADELLGPVHPKSGSCCDAKS